VGAAAARARGVYCAPPPRPRTFRASVTSRPARRSVRSWYIRTVAGSTGAAAPVRPGRGGGVRHGRPAAAAVLVGLLLAVTTSCDRVESPTAAGQRGPAFGTLASLPRFSADAGRAGGTAAGVELSGELADPAEGQFDGRYLGGVRAKADELRSTGRTITLELGLHNPPRWLLAQPDSRLVDDAG